MSDFSFVGAVPASKSLLNRALMVQSFQPHLSIQGDSAAEDVRAMRGALAAFKNGEAIDCGAAGTVFRFMALRVAREPGRYQLRGSPRLLARPHQDLLKILGQLGCQVELNLEGLSLRSWGWKMVGDALHVPIETSSQFASAVLLSAWELPFKLCLLLGPKPVSEGYLTMTLRLVRQLGMQVEGHGREIMVGAGQKVTATTFQVEPDMSSAFALAACAAVSGQVRLTGFSQESWQPDLAFVELLAKMGVPIKYQDGCLEVGRAKALRGITADLGKTPDLFPVLAALGALAEGDTVLTGAPQLAFKESNRLQRTAELLRLVGREVWQYDDGLKVRGRPAPVLGTPVVFDVDEDHRLAMAAGVLAMAGEPIRVNEPSVVRKSFPNFWQILGMEKLAR